MYKRLSFFIILIFFTLFSFSQTEEKVGKDIFISKYPNGQKQSQGAMIHGVEYGRWQYWTDEGVLIQVTDFFKGKVHGAIIYYYGNGNKKNEGEFYFNMQKGPYKEWYRNGQLKESGFYQFGFKDSLWTYYHENGHRIKTLKFTPEGTKIESNWNTSNIQTVINGSGKFQDFYANSQ